MVADAHVLEAAWIERRGRFLTGGCCCFASSRLARRGMAPDTAGGGKQDFPRCFGAAFGSPSGWSRAGRREGGCYRAAGCAVAWLWAGWYCSVAWFEAAQPPVEVCGAAEAPRAPAAPAVALFADLRRLCGGFMALRVGGVCTGFPCWVHLRVWSRHTRWCYQGYRLQALICWLRIRLRRLRAVLRWQRRQQMCLQRLRKHVSGLGRHLWRKVSTLKTFTAGVCLRCIFVRWCQQRYRLRRRARGADCLGLVRMGLWRLRTRLWVATRTQWPYRCLR